MIFFSFKFNDSKICLAIEFPVILGKRVEHSLQSVLKKPIDFLLDLALSIWRVGVQSETSTRNYIADVPLCLFTLHLSEYIILLDLYIWQLRAIGVQKAPLYKSAIINRCNKMSAVNNSTNEKSKIFSIPFLIGRNLAIERLLHEDVECNG